MARGATKKKRVTESEVSPLIYSGLTQGVPKKEALKAHPVRTTGSDVSHMRDVQPSGTRRVPLAKFVAEDDLGSVWIDHPTGRLQRNAAVTFQPEVMQALRAGEICLRCLEPQDQAFPSVCTSPPEMGCSYPIKERQIMDIAMEFEGNKHIGPSKPITEYMTELELRTEKRRFIDQQVEKGSLERIPKDWLRDATLFPDGPPKQLG